VDSIWKLKMEDVSDVSMKGGAKLNFEKILVEGVG
jgi:hypothetical protein